MRNVGTNLRSAEMRHSKGDELVKVALKDHFGPGRSRAFSPFLAPDERKKLHLLLDFGDGPPPSFADALRSLARRYIDDGSSEKLRAV